MVTKRQLIQKAAAEIVAPIVESIGLELIDVEYIRQGRDHSLCLYLDRPGGVTVEELQKASRAVEKVLEVSEIVMGRYRLEVSSPGIDRPWKRLEDFRNNVGSRVKLKTFNPLHDGRRIVTGRIHSTRGEEIIVDPDEGTRLTIPYRNIASAKPQIDWEELLKKDGRSTEKESHARRSL